MLQFGNNIWYYNKNIKNMIIGFLNIFPQMQVRKFSTETGSLENITQVPILFGPIERSSYINSRNETVQRTVQLPMMHFELTGMELDKNRAFAMKTLHIQGMGQSGIERDNLMPYPYNFTITMTIYARYEEELMQLIEQIVPLFNYHRVYYAKHPIFPDDITLSYWAMITAYPSFAFNHEYSAEERRDILSVPITFSIEGWLVRESYDAGGVIKEIITNYKDYASQAGLSQVRMLADPTIRDVIYTANPMYTPSVGQLISGSGYHATIVDNPGAASGFSGFSSYYMDGAASGWSGYSDGHLVVKFNNEHEVFLTNELLRVGLSYVGATVSCEPYMPFLEAEYGWSGYSGYSGYSEFKTDGNSGIL